MSVAEISMMHNPESAKSCRYVTDMEDHLNTAARLSRALSDMLLCYDHLNFEDTRTVEGAMELAGLVADHASAARYMFYNPPAPREQEDDIFRLIEGHRELGRAHCAALNAREAFRHAGTGSAEELEAIERDIADALAEQVDYENDILFVAKPKTKAGALALLKRAANCESNRPGYSRMLANIVAVLEGKCLY